MYHKLLLILELGFYALIMFLILYFVAVKGPIAEKILEWRKNANKELKRKSKKYKLEENENQ